MVGVSEGEREQVAEELRRRAAAGHLTEDQLAERLHRARTVITRAGLDGILLDLPGGPAGLPERPWALPDAGRPPAAEPPPSPAPPPTPVAEPPAPPPQPVGPWPTPTSAPPAAPSDRGPWAMPTSAPPAAPGHRGPWAMPTSAPPAPEPVFEPGVGLWPLPKKPSAEPPEAPEARVATRLPGEGKRRPVVGVVGLVTIGLAATWWIGDMADNATEVSDRPPDPPATTDVPAIEAPAPTTTTTTTRPTGTTIPHLDGWQTLVVGEDIQPGIVTSDADLGYCGWSRVITVDDGRSAEGVANGGGPRPVVEVKPTDRVLLAHSCGPWEPYVPADTPATTMGDGDWLVGADVAAGRYRTSSDDPDCYWERGRDFTRDPTTHLENNGGDGRTVVDLVDGERFTAYQCGTWTRDG